MSNARIIMLVGGVVAFLTTLFMVRRREMREKYAAAWIIAAFVLLGCSFMLDPLVWVATQVRVMPSAIILMGALAVAYIFAEGPELTAHLLEPAQLGEVQDAYRDVMHEQARDLMSRGNWQDAILLWRHLHQRKLVSQSLYLDAARCFKQLGQPEDAIRVLGEALTTFGDTANVVFAIFIWKLAMLHKMSIYRLKP